MEADLSWRDQILAGDDAAWHRFVQRFSDRAVETAVRWCDLGCRFPGGCSLKRGPGGPFRRFLDGDCRCDRVPTAYYFILEKLREKLAGYRGERDCRLDTWVRHLLTPLPRHASGAAGVDYGYRQLYADYLRRTEGRIRAPAEILRREPVLEQIYVLYHYGRDEATICQTLGLSPVQLEQAVERIEEILRKKGAEFFWRFWGHLWVPREVDSLSLLDLDGPDEALEPPALLADAHTEWEAGAVQAAIVEALQRLTPLTRHVLWLSFDQGLSAAQIAAGLRAQELASWTPRQVYTEIDRALAEICRRVGATLAPVDEVTVSPRGMKEIFDYWSVGRFLGRARGEREVRR